MGEPAKWSSHDLCDYSGRDGKLPTLMSATGIVFDVSTSESYAVGQSYNALAGRDASRSLALMSLKEEDCISDLEGIDAKQQQVLDDWVNYFVYRKKYPVVGVVPRIRPNGWNPSDLPPSKFATAAPGDDDEDEEDGESEEAAADAQQLGEESISRSNR